MLLVVWIIVGVKVVRVPSFCPSLDSDLSSAVGGAFGGAAEALASGGGLKTLKKLTVAGAVGGVFETLASKGLDLLQDCKGDGEDEEKAGSCP